MAAFRTTVQVGKHAIWVEAENFEDLIKRVAYLQELAQDATDDAHFYFRQVGDDEYLGLQRFRKVEGDWERQELRFGKLKKPPLGGDFRLFTYNRSSDQYEERGGWRWYNAETGEAEYRAKRSSDNEE